MLDTQINAFESQVTARWDGSMPPVDFSGDLITASSTRGLEVADVAQLTGVGLEMDRLRSLGAKAVTVSLGFPLLYRPFHQSNGNTENYDKLAAFYTGVATAARQRGFRLIVKTGPLLPEFLFANSGLNLGNYYAGLSPDQYVAARAATAGEIARVMRPDYMVVASQPNIEAAITGKASLGTIPGFVDLVNRSVTSVNAASSGFRILTGAGVATSDSNGLAYITALAATSLDFIDLQVNGRTLQNAITFADAARERGKGIALSEFWLRKERDIEAPTTSNLSILARDAFSFWEPLDQKFIAALVKYAYAKDALLVSASGSRYFYAYVNYDDVAQLPPDQIIARQLAAAVASLVNNRFTGAGQQYGRFITPAGSRPAIVSAAALEGDRSVAADSLISIFGANLANTTATATTLPLPSSLGGTEVTIIDSAGQTRQVPLLYVSPGQVNGVLPSSLAAGVATLVVRAPSRDPVVGKEARSVGTLRVSMVAPSLFAINASGRGAAAAYVQRLRGGVLMPPEFVFECGTAPGSCRVKPIDLGPADDRVVLVLFGTGFRRMGETAKINLGGVELTPEFIGDQRQYAGLDQASVTIPRSLLGRSSLEVRVSAGGMTSNPVMISTTAAQPLPTVTSRRTVVTGRSGELARPSYSPDGQWIIFDRRDERDVWQVRRIPANGGTEECLTCNRSDMPGHNGAARVHPSGRYVVFTSEQANHAPALPSTITPGAGFYHDIVVLDLNTREFHRIRRVRSAPTPGAIPADPGGTLFVRFSPDGSRLLWGDLEGLNTLGLWPAGRFGNFRLGIAQFETSPTPRLVNEVFYNPGPRPEFFEVQGWSSDGTAIYTACTPSLNQDENALDFCRLNLATGELVGVSQTSGTNNEAAEYEEHGEGSPDGSLIAYMSSIGHGIQSSFFLNWLRTDLWLMRPDGSERRQVTFYNVPGHPDSLAAGSRAIVSEMAWHPQGNAVVAAVFFDHADRLDEHAIIVFNIGR
jgi:uncharacterized protein (TIGR03437 family)